MGWRLRSYSHDLEVTQIKMPLRLHTSCLGSCCLCFLGSINGCLNLWIYLTKKNGFRSHAVVVSKWVQRWSLGLDFCWERTCCKRHKYDPLNRECRSFTFVQKAGVKDNFHRILFFPFLLCLVKVKCFDCPNCQLQLLAIFQNF